MFKPFDFLLGVFSGLFLGSGWITLFMENAFQLPALGFDSTLIALAYSCIGLLFFLALVLRNKVNSDVLAFVSTGVFIIFLIAVLSNTFIVPAYYDSVGTYTSWGFHECYSNSLDAVACTGSEITPFFNDTRGYEYYPPLSHLIGKLVGMKILLVLLFVGLWIVLLLGNNSFVAPVVVFMAAPNLWLSFIRGGTVPFFLFLFIVLLYFYRQPNANVFEKGLFVVSAFFAHSYGGLWFVGFLVLLEVLQRVGFKGFRVSVYIVLFGFATALYFFAYMNSTIRVFLIPLALCGLLFYNGGKPIELNT